MKRFLLFSLLAAGASVLAPAAVAAPPPGDSVSGTGVAITGENFSIDAISNASGHGARGSMSFTITDPAASGVVTARVTCLSASGNQAVVGGRVTSSTSIAFSKNDGVRWFVRDDNNPDDLRIEPAPTPVDCTTAATTSPIQSGNLTVVDS